MTKKKEILALVSYAAMAWSQANFNSHSSLSFYILVSKIKNMLFLIDSMDENDEKKYLNYNSDEEKTTVLEKKVIIKRNIVCFQKSTKDKKNDIP